MAPRRGRRRSRRRSSTRQVTGLLVALLAAGLALFLTRGGVGDGAVDAGPPAAQPANGAVVEVVDGDTLVVRVDGGEERLRLIGIDTPESVATDRPDECFGQEASDRLAHLLPAGTPVRVERDVEPRDRYDRLLGYVYRSNDGLFVNHDMVARGFAEAKSYPPNTTHEPRLEAAEADARRRNAGLWSTCGAPDVPV
jgi:micrococcal nuclease